jgi:hypothetical protein
MLKLLSRKSAPFAQEISFFSPRKRNAVIPPGGWRAREKLPENAQTPTSRVHAVLGREFGFVALS